MQSSFAAIVLYACLSTMGCTSSASDAAPATEALDAAPSDPALRAALVSRFARDQKARKDMNRALRDAPIRADGSTIYPDSALPLVHAVLESDADSIAFMNQVIDEHGWPTIDRVGRDGAEAAWLLVQHADAAPELQRRALDLMQPLAARGQASVANLAYLTDRVRVAQRMPQLYGTQFRPDTDGVQRPYPIEDAAHVDARRAAVGLPSIATYARQLESAVGGRARTDPLEHFPAH